MERTRRGKNQRARSGSVNVLSGAPFGYRYVRKSEHAAARYEVVPHEAAIVAGLFRRYADEGVAIADLARWLGSTGVTTRTGKTRWDRSTIWGMLRNPAYAGRACFGKTGRLPQQAGRNRVARLAGRATGTAYTTVDRPRSDLLEIDVPALVDEATFERVARRLAVNKKFASRASKTPSLLQGLAACSGCGYACYRGHTTTTAGNKIFYYRCIGSDNYRFEHGKVCGNKPVRADYLDQVVWDHITHLIANPRPDPRRDRPAPGPDPPRRPGHRPAQASRRRPRQDHQRDHQADRRLPGRPPVPRRAPRPDARSTRPRDQP